MFCILPLYYWHSLEGTCGTCSGKCIEMLRPVKREISLTQENMAQKLVQKQLICHQILKKKKTWRILKKTPCSIIYLWGELHILLIFCKISLILLLFSVQSFVEAATRHFEFLSSHTTRRVENMHQHTVPLSLLFSINLRIWTCSSSTTKHTDTQAQCYIDRWGCRFDVVWEWVTYPQSSFLVCDSHVRTLYVSASPRLSPHACLSHPCPGHMSGETAENYSSVA